MKSVLSYGAKADNSKTNEGTDNLSAFKRAIAASSRVYIPASDKGYRLSEPLVINKKIEFFGDGADSKIVGNIKILTDECHLHDFQIHKNWEAVSEGFNDDNDHGIWVSSNGNKLERITALNFDGDGFLISGDVNRIPKTNANQNVIRNCAAFGNGRAGIHFQGGDSNQCSVENFNAVSNALCGIWEGSFLGNKFSSPHCATNCGGHNFNKTIVTHNGKVYWCIQDNINKEPGLSPDHWIVWDGGGLSSVWKPDINYFAGAAYYFTNSANQKGSFDDAYVEGDQVAMYSTTKSLIINGFLAKTRQGIYMDAENGTVNMPNVQANGDVDIALLGKGYNTIGAYDVENGLIFGLKYYPNHKGFFFASNNSGSRTGFLSSKSSGALIGRSAGINGGLVVDGLFPYNSNQDNYRLMAFADSIPVSGEYAKGDILFYNGDDPHIIQFRCIESGSPGKWIVIKTN